MEAFHLVILILHVLVACLLVGIAFFVLVYVAKPTLSATEAALARRFANIGRPLAGFQLLLGLTLVGLEPDKFVRNPLIGAKLGLLVVNAIVAVVLVEKKLELIEKNGSDDKLIKTLRLGSVLLFGIVVLIVALGVTAAETAS